MAAKEGGKHIQVFVGIKQSAGIEIANRGKKKNKNLIEGVETISEIENYPYADCIQEGNSPLIWEPKWKKKGEKSNCGKLTKVKRGAVGRV